MLKKGMLSRLCAWITCALLAGFVPVSGAQMADRDERSAFFSAPERIAFDIREILIRNDMPISHEGENPWLEITPKLDLIGTGDVLYLLSVNRMEEIPLAARMEIIEYCMRLHKKREWSNYLRLQMRSSPRQTGLLLPKPDFELVLSATY